MFKLLIIMLLLTGCSNHNVEDIKQHSTKVFNDAGFEVVGYEGYEYTSPLRWGGCVWYIITRNRVTYDACISKWGDEYHIYNLSAKDAIKGN